MAKPSENDMDQLLKRYAKQRRRDTKPALGMPAATRQALHREVARTYRQAAVPPAWLRLFVGFWPRLAFGGGLIAFLAFVALFSLKSDKNPAQRLELAKHIAEDGLSTTPAPAMDRDANVPSLGASLRTASGPAPKAVPTEGLSGGSSSKASDRASFGRVLDNPVSEVPGSPALTAIADEKLPSAPALTAPNQPNNSSAPRPASSPADATLMLGRSEQSTSKSLAESVRFGATKGEPALRSGTPEKSTPTGGATLNLSAAERPPADAYGLPNVESQALAAAAASTTPAQVLLADSKETPTTSASSPTQAYRFQAQRLATSAGTEPAAQRLLFNQVDLGARYRRNFNSPAVPNVLRQFELQQQGENLVVIDADGSVYEGLIQLARTNLQQRGVASVSQTRARAVRANVEPGDGQSQNQPGSAGLAAEVQMIENLAFRAEGTNRSSKQKVVFTGNFLNQIPQNEKIEGNVILGGRNFTIEAVRAQPQK